MDFHSTLAFQYYRYRPCIDTGHASAIKLLFVWNPLLVPACYETHIELEGHNTAFKNAQVQGVSCHEWIGWLFINVSSSHNYKVAYIYISIYA